MASDVSDPQPPAITVTAHGPYRVTGAVSIRAVDGEVLRDDGAPVYLCRCGGSRAKPFCDATHGLKGFDGTESADHDPITARRARYPSQQGVIVYDDRTRCAHFGQCTDRLPQVFRAGAEPFVDATTAEPADLVEVVSGCPSGALAHAVEADPTAVEEHGAASITPVVDGPYRVRGAVQVVGADGVPYEVRERQTLCRCGHSADKPFCDGSHFYAEFRDPAPAAAVPTLYDWAGGIEALQRLTARFYADLLDEPDPVLEPVFRGMDPAHPAHVAAWLAETFGGPATFTAEHGGYEHMVAKHRGLDLTETQRRRWISRMATTADLVGLPDDPDFRAAFTAYLEWGTRIAVFNSAPDAPVIEHAPVPTWGWGESAPYVPQPWDDPDAADRGRRRWAEENPTPSGEAR
jgi:CDGSH-type Zn-finger protein/truncated hemoglobin YjbI/ferredoxin